MQPQLGIWKRLIRSLLGVDRCSLIGSETRFEVGHYPLYGVIVFMMN